MNLPRFSLLLFLTCSIGIGQLFDAPSVFAMFVMFALDGAVVPEGLITCGAFSKIYFVF